MSEHNFEKEPRWRNAGYWTNAYDDQDREGDRETSRNYDREDMRRYAQRSVDQGGRLRDLRGGDDDQDDISAMGRASQNRGYDFPGREWARRGERGAYPGEHYGWSVRGAGGRWNRRGEWRGPADEIDMEREDIRDIRHRPGARFGGPNQGNRSGMQRRAGGEYGPRDRGYDAIDNYWGQRRQNQFYGGRRDPNWDYERDPDRDDWWDQTAGRPGYTSARRPGNNDINRAREDDGQTDFESRGYDMDPGFAYEFGTDFDFMSDARRQELEQRQREQEWDQQRRGRAQRSQPRDTGRAPRGEHNWWAEGQRGERQAGRPGRQDADRPDYGSHGSGQSRHPNRAQSQRERGQDPYRSPRDQGEQAGQRFRPNWEGRPDNMSFRYSREWQSGPYTGVGPQGYQRSDERIREEIAEIYTRNGRIDAVGIDVRVENGEVTLTGEVNSRNEKHLANDIAESVPGVREVINRLRVATDADLW